ncbi:rCG22542 [Rattus norvegicus]|uniref:RCG22542 n=1 Tax=Rattus norvegicus TaxID=10116 RepID=A6IPH5_RAT|nr:rCG22542 [Rattus norvegicus]
MQIDTDHLEAYPKFKSLNKLFSNSKEDLKIKNKIKHPRNPFCSSDMRLALFLPCYQQAIEGGKG